MTDTFDRTQLDGKDRGQLSEIAAALGVKSVSRMRKAELVDAIVSAAKGSAGAGGTNGSEPARPRKIRSTASGGDDLAALAAEEDSLVSSDTPADDMVVRRPSTASTATKPAAPATAPGRARDTDDSTGDSHDDSRDDSTDDGGPSAQQGRDDDGQGNRRRRRRRGRDRDRPNGGEQRESRARSSPVSC